VLAALGIPPAVGRGSLRLSLGWDTEAAEVDHALTVVPTSVARLRRYEP
jgi:cysteine sulfinate desulfinase/cysteine desulfurase-like protein